MFYYIENQLWLKVDKPKNRVVDNLFLINLMLSHKVKLFRLQKYKLLINYFFVNAYFAGFGHSEVSLYILEQNKQAYLLTHYKLLDLHYEIVIFLQ